MIRPALADCVPLDVFGVTCVRGPAGAEVLDRLAAGSGATSHPRCTAQEALDRFGHGPDRPAVRVCAQGAWTFLIDVAGHGLLTEPAETSRLSVGGEAVSVHKVLDGHTVVSHAHAGVLLAHIDAWAVHLTSGADPFRMNRALATAGFFRYGQDLWSEEHDEEPEVPSVAALMAFEEEFGARLTPGTAAAPLPTVDLTHLRARA
ncbi:DUF6461 domain-containing protein [Streptomyces bohaiensis]|uniref:Uncharacterized protein n=1 Tax=Streptomyces bohaiensis TaxID=1431344 RepID=A0ABX1CIZ1_9ACTN|nr:DUF6461 domain-containing protein [Streptomyces bohaiensis]NJQ17122.1 hypothetical protein [Streptomyces bohaiensis]